MKAVTPEMMIGATSVEIMVEPADRCNVLCIWMAATHPLSHRERGPISRMTGIHRMR